MSLSIVVCATNPELVEKLRKNICGTMGKDSVYEIIALDNTLNPKSISEVYNEGARKARYENLLFIHQDAGFVSKDWLDPIEEKLREPGCGVIGFAGSILMVNAPGGWNVMPQWCIFNLEECGVPNRRNLNPEKPFVEVVAVDGFAIFVRKDVWEKHPFDEYLLTGFHCYDVDFSLGIGSEYKNYVCCDIQVFHNSCGSFGKDWAAATLKLYTEKWHMMLPRYVEGAQLAPDRERSMEERVTFRFLKMARRHGLPAPQIKSAFLKFPLTLRHLEHLFKYYILKSK